MIAIVVIIGLLGLAKRGRGRRRGVRALKCSENLGLTTLADETIVAQAFDSTVDDTTFVLSIEATWALSGHTAGEGPITVGVAHSDYSAAEILEWFNAGGSWDRGDKIANEQRRRKCRQVGTFPGLASEEVLNEGKALKTPLKFNLSPGDTLQQWAMNQSGGSLTTGSIVDTNGTVWAAL